MFQVWLSTYALNYRFLPGKTRLGVLIKIQDKDGLTGYSDLSPWPELGDPDIKTLLESPRHPLFQMAYRNACTFYYHRKSISEWVAKKNEGSSNNALLSHFSEIDQLQKYKSLGYQIVKFKIGIDLEQEIQILNNIAKETTGLKWRLDGNIRLSHSDWEYFWDHISPLAKMGIQYVEDPFPFEIESWKNWNQIIPLALDFALDSESPQLIEAARIKAFDVYVAKPSRQDVSSLFLKIPSLTKISITSQLGHLIDSLWSGWTHSQVRLQYPDRVLPIAGTLNHLVLKEESPLKYSEINSIDQLDRALKPLDWRLYENTKLD
jgi:O-succinylbenzoate synthase